MPSQICATTAQVLSSCDCRLWFPECQQEGAYLLVGELTKALEEPSRRRGAADAIALFCRTAKFDFQEHLSSFITVRRAPPADLSSILAQTWSILLTVPGELTCAASGAGCRL